MGHRSLGGILESSTSGIPDRSVGPVSRVQGEARKSGRNARIWLGFCANINRAIVALGGEEDPLDPAIIYVRHGVRYFG
jgi:hypothetical protein